MNLKKCKELRRQIKQAFKFPSMTNVASYDKHPRKKFVDEKGETVKIHYQVVLQNMCPRFIYQRAKKVIGHVSNKRRWGRTESRPRQEAGRREAAADGGVPSVLSESA